jgi:predicted nucleic acid-binding protein
LLAAIDQRDTEHARCAELLAAAREPRVIPAPVLVELDYFLTRSFGPDPMRRILDDVKAGAFSIEPLIAEDYDRVGELMTTYSDQRIGFVDASVLAIVERLREPKLATLDHRHFAVMRPRHTNALDLLPT